MKYLTIDGVTFIVAECVKMCREDFINRHIDVFWPGKDKATRRKVLSKAYTLMARAAGDDTES